MYTGILLIVILQTIRCLTRHVIFTLERESFIELYCMRGLRKSHFSEVPADVDTR